jgi:serine/threonine-protein kinase
MDRIGRYEILDELGRGAMGVVYRARDTKIGREVAIKTIRLTDKVNPSEVNALRERLFREAQSAGRLSHPGIVTIFDIEEEDDLAYISMELVDGQTLEHKIEAGETGDLAFVGQVTRLAAAALDYAHSRDIVHRDIKPANLMINREGRVKITDFGIARISSSQLTQTGTVMGTPSYMSPEQVKGDPLDGRSDQFSLAVIVYEMLTGQKPFAGENLTSVMFKIVSETPIEPKDLNPKIPPPVQESLLKALSKNPSDRYPACAAFAAALVSQIEAAADIRVGTSGIPKTAGHADETLELGATAPSLETFELEEVPEGAAGENRLAGAPALKPLSSRPGAPQVVAAGGSKLPTPARPAGRTREPQTVRRLWPYAAVVALLVAAAALLAFHPWLLDDPLGLARAVVSPRSTDARMRSSVNLLLEKALQPLPPADLTEPLEAAVQLRQGAQAAAQPESAAPAADADTDAALTDPAQEDAARAEGDAPTESAEAPADAPETPAAEQPVAKAEQKQAPAPRAPSTPAARLVSVSVKTSTPGAQVVVDRNPAWSCIAPCSIEVPRGRHVAVASLAGYRSYPKIFEAGSGAAELDIQMRAISGTLLISSEPAGAEVFVDGRKVEGATNLQHDAGPGYHVISVRKQGAGTAERSVRVQEGGLHPIHFVLNNAGVNRSRLSVRSDPAGAEIVVNDNRRVGTTPADIELAPGRYRVAVSRNGYRPVIQEIELTAGKPQNLEVTLSPQN